MSDTVTRYVVDHINARDLIGDPDGVLPWEDFPADPGWTSSLRIRRLPGGVQMVGSIIGPLPANQRFRIGTLPVGYRPERSVIAVGTVIVGQQIGFGTVDVTAPDGQTWTWWSIAGDGSLIALSIVFPLD